MYNGQINQTNPTWKFWKLGQYFHTNEYNIRAGIDYHTLNWQNRSLNLDDIVAPAGHCVTGVRFNVDSGRLKLEIRTNAFDFLSGKLTDVGSDNWISKPHEQRAAIVLKNVDVSTRAPSKSIPNIDVNRYIEFGPTDKYLDAAQTTVPFIDTQLVQPHQPILLSGIGVYYKGQPYYGGFIAPKVITYDFEPYMHTYPLPLGSN